MASCLTMWLHCTLPNSAHAGFVHHCTLQRLAGAALFLDMHTPGSAAAVVANDAAATAAWQLLADALRAEAEAMRRSAGDLITWLFLSLHCAAAFEQLPLTLSPETACSSSFRSIYAAAVWYSRPDDLEPSAPFFTSLRELLLRSLQTTSSVRQLSGTPSPRAAGGGPTPSSPLRPPRQLSVKLPEQRQPPRQRRLRQPQTSCRLLEDPILCKHSG